MRIGNSIDYHKFARNRDLILGGIKIPYHKGLIGDSDADIIMHSISEAILGALSLGDLGTYFNKKNALGLDSKEILMFSYGKMIEMGYKISNIDCMVVIEKPILRDYILLIRENISKILDININQISIKATTMEKDGIIGCGKGALALATVLLED